MSRVLIVDDDTDSSELLGALLTRAGHIVQTVSSLSLAQAALSGVEVVICDRNLDGEDGLDLFATPATSSFAGLAIMVSGDGTARNQAKQRGFGHYMQKPVNLTQLLQVVRGPLDEVKSDQSPGGRAIS